MVRTNLTKAKINEGQVALGASINFYAPGLVELYGVMGFDWVWIDCEHGSSNDSETENMVRAAELYDLTPICRIPNAYPSTILRFLDRGAQGIIVPHISTPEEAEGVARASHHYPDGDRSSATGGRTNRFGSGLSTPDYYAAANREVLVIVMIETPEAVENVRAIAAVPGIDALLVGSSDLTQTMGMASSAELDAAIDKVIEGAQAEGKAIGVAGAGMSLNNVPRFQHFASRGVQLMSIGAQDMVRASGDGFLRTMRG